MGVAREKERETAKRRLKKEGRCNGKKRRMEGEGQGRSVVGERAPSPRDSLRKVQRYKAPVIYFGLPWLVYPLVLVRSLLDVFKRSSNETTGTNKQCAQLWIKTEEKKRVENVLGNTIASTAIVGLVSIPGIMSQRVVITRDVFVLMITVVLKRFITVESCVAFYCCLR